MTHIDTDVKDCAAEFLFILCKESGKELHLSYFLRNLFFYKLPNNLLMHAYNLSVVL